MAFETISGLADAAPMAIQGRSFTSATVGLMAAVALVAGCGGRSALLPSASSPVDVSHPRNPVETATWRLPSAYANHVGGNEVINGDYAYSAVPKVESERGGIIVFRIANLP